MNEEKIGNYISKLRKDNNMTQEELASKLGLSTKIISRWEKGVNIPDLVYFKELSKIFNVSVADLLSGENVNEKDLKVLGDRLIDYTDLKITKMTKKNKNMYILEKLVVALVSAILTIIIYGNYIN